MKTIRVGDRNYSLVIFRPVEALRSTVPGRGEIVVVQRVAIFEDAGVLAGNGFAFCSPKDEFDPMKGIGIALGRALRQVKVRGEQRKNPYDPETKPRSHAAFEKVLQNRPDSRSLTPEEKHQFYVLAGVAPK